MSGLSPHNSCPSVLASPFPSQGPFNFSPLCPSKFKARVFTCGPNSTWPDELVKVVVERVVEDSDETKVLEGEPSISPTVQNEINLFKNTMDAINNVWKEEIFPIVDGDRKLASIKEVRDTINSFKDRSKELQLGIEVLSFTTLRDLDTAVAKQQAQNTLRVQKLQVLKAERANAWAQGRENSKNLPLDHWMRPGF